MSTVTALVIGGGPAGIMAADRLLSAGHEVVLADAKPSLGRKFLMAGKSGLNLTKMEEQTAFLAAYPTLPAPVSKALQAFGPVQVSDWAQGLGQEVFTGSTGRLFPKAMKASPLLRAWLARLDSMGLRRETRWRWRGWDGTDCLFDTPEGAQRVTPKVTVLALGGASWARLGSDGLWGDVLRSDGHGVVAFAPSNSGVSVHWSAHMAPHFGAALKNILLRAGPLESRGEAMISHRGLEGGGVYSLTPALRDGDALTLDFAPDQSLASLTAKAAKASKGVKFTAWLRKAAKLSAAKTAVVLEVTKGAAPRPSWAEAVKSLTLPYGGLRPMDEAISTAGGLSCDALDEGFMLQGRPGTFCAGEMLDWEAPTGGYLITACLATGRRAGDAAADFLTAHA